MNREVFDATSPIMSYVRGHLLDRRSHWRRRLGGPSDQFSVGRSTLSITITSVGTRCGSSLRPSCSCTAVKIDGASAGTGIGDGVGDSGANVRSKSYAPVRFVRSTTG